MSTTTPGNSRNLPQEEILQQFAQSGKDPFNRNTVEEIFITKGDEKIYNKIIFENESWYAIPNLWPLPNSNNHITIISQRNIKTPFELQNHEWSDLIKVIDSLSQEHSIKKGLFSMRFGDPEIAGTTVTHLHGHLISVIKNEKVKFPIGARASKIIPFMQEGNLSQDFLFAPETWGVRKYLDGIPAFKFELQGDLLCDIWNITHFEWDEFRTILKRVVKEFKLKGGAVCIEFDLLHGINAWLISPSGQEKTFFEIKN